jgi:hypothetical protein
LLSLLSSYTYRISATLNIKRIVERSIGNFDLSQAGCVCRSFLHN